MRCITRQLSYILVLIACTTMASALNYFYFSENETTVLNERIKFYTGDTLTGPVRSNDAISIMGTPVFTDWIISGAEDIDRGPGYAPRFVGPSPFFNALPIDLPQNADTFRLRAMAQGFYFNPGDTMKARLQLSNHNIRISWSRIGSPVDTTVYSDHVLPDYADVFFECPIDVSGIVGSMLILGASGRIGLEDNVIYASSDPVSGQIVPDHPEMLAIISEADVKVLNTPQNGRGNSHGLGRSQTDQDLTSIRLNGYFVALHESFTFENQNDPDSGYSYGFADERGTIYLWGGIVQKRHGYLHRSNFGGTGYLKRLRWDNVLESWDFGLFHLRENEVDPLFLDLGEVTIGDSARNRIHISNEFTPITIDSVTLAPPFYALPLSDSLRFDRTLTVWFAPTVAGDFDDSVTFWISDYGRRSVLLHGHGLPVNPTQDLSRNLYPSSFSLSCYPNPFNPTTTISFTLPQAGEVKLAIYDVLGRLADGQVRALSLQAGEHHLTFDGSDLASGIYLVKLEAADRVLTRKMVLMK